MAGGGGAYFCVSSMKLFQADSIISWLEEEGASAFGTRHGKHCMEISFWPLAVLSLLPRENFAVVYQV